MLAQAARSGRWAAVGFAWGLLACLCSAAPSQAQEIKRGGTMVVALPGDPEVLNSSITTDISSSNLCGQVYSTLVRLDNDGVVQPYLAKSWEISPDGRLCRIVPLWETNLPLIPESWPAHLAVKPLPEVSSAA